MSEAVIRAEGLGKRYRIGDREAGGLLRDKLGRALRSPLSMFRRKRREEFWALKDVSLEVREGEVLGLIGRNGAGKTTLLKILSRITRPTTGWAEVRGHVGSLLEVGTGFHPELTGRENAFLSGAILGMKKAEIERKFDEIVAFAEIEKFIDTPVKHYSSGMYVRLAFAVAAHLEPEILLVDEVLAVGDLKFQKKCLGKMGDVARAGRTVVLVSHQMNQIRRLCQRVVWVDGGEIRRNGPAQDVVSAYEAAMSGGELAPAGRERGAGVKARFVRWEIAPTRDEPHTVKDLEPLTVKVVIAVGRPLKRAFHGIALYNHDQQLIWSWGRENMQLEIGEHQFCHKFPMLPLRPGTYSWLVTIYEDGNLLDSWNCVPEMNIAMEVFQYPRDEWVGILNMPTCFEVVSDSLTNLHEGT